MTTPILDLDELAGSQSQPHVPINAFNRAMEQYGQLIVLDKDLTAPPGSPSEGDAYIVAAGATGDWDDWDEDVAYYSGGWLRLLMREGVIAYVVDEAAYYQRGAATWAAFAPSGSPSGAAGGDLTGTYPNPTIDAAAVTLAKMADLAANSIIGNNTGSPATPIALTVAQVKTLLAYAVADVTGAAPLASPTFTGTPAAPTAAAATNTTQIATTAFVQAAVAALINSAPGALDTLDELAAALGDDANFAATITGLLALKAPLASPTFTGTAAAPTPSAADNSTKIATTAYVEAAVAAGLSSKLGIPWTCAGKPADGGVYHIMIPVACTIAVSLTGTTGYSGTNATATATFSLKKNGAAAFGTVAFGSGSSTPTLTSASGATFAAGDRLTITAPTPQDSTLADVGFTLLAVRT